MPGPGAHGAPARVGGVRARHPLQGRGARGARPRPRPPVHAGRRAPRARRPRVLADPRPAAGAAPDELPRPTDATRGPRTTSRRSSASGTPTPAGRAPTTTAGSPGCCSSSASPRSRSSPATSTASTATSSTAGMGYGNPPTAVRRLDDALLFLFDERYVGLHGNAHRTELLRTRMARLGQSAVTDVLGRVRRVRVRRRRPGRPCCGSAGRPCRRPSRRAGSAPAPRAR